MSDLVDVHHLNNSICLGLERRLVSFNSEIGISSCLDSEIFLACDSPARMDTSYLTTQVSTIIGQLHDLFDEIGVPGHERESRESEVG